MAAIVRVRVRGIYATALTKIFIDEGFQIVQASSLISSRFGIPQLPAAADVTVKSVEDEPSRLLVIGYPEKTEKVVSALSKHLTSSPRWRSKAQLYSTIVARITRGNGDKCIAKLDDIEFEVVDVQECKEGELIVGWVVKAPIFPGERGRLAPGVRVVGDYAMLYESTRPRVTISEHVHGTEKRALLSALATEYTREGLGVHWRSSARDAEENVLREELKVLRERLEEARKRAAELVEAGQVGIVTPGEELYIVELSSVDKRKLDSIRDTVVPTIPLHHTIKSLGDDKLNVIVDYAEHVLQHNRGIVNDLYNGLLDYIVEYIEGKKIRIEHVKLDGRLIELGQGVVREARIHDEGIRIRVERVVKTPGVYDGLGVEKEPGDVIESVVDTSEWTIKHIYRSRSGELKGEYININTPPEVVPGRIRYIDLSVDIVRLPDGTVKVIDIEEFRKFVREGIVTRELAERVARLVEEIAGAKMQL